MHALLGIDLGGTNVKAGLVDTQGQLHEKLCIPTPSRSDYSRIIDAIVHIADTLGSRHTLVGVGVGSPGIIDSRTGVVKYSNNIAVQSVEVAAPLSRRLGLPVSILNDASAATLAEWQMGAGRGNGSMILLTLGTGVGCGVVADGRLIEGGGNTAGGHIVVQQGGRLCNCGGRGCLETYASATALIADTKVAMQTHSDSLLWQLAPDGNPDGQTAFQAEQLGDRAATDVIQRYIEYLGSGIVTLYNLLFPDLVVLGGGVSAQGANLTDRLTDYVRKYIYSRDKQLVRIECARLGNDAGLLGAALYADTIHNLNFFQKNEM